ncbi:unnamed protein product, partial [Ectocarpus sp. 13 AM-2016]
HVYILGNYFSRNQWRKLEAPRSTQPRASAQHGRRFRKARCRVEHLATVLSSRPEEGQPFPQVSLMRSTPGTRTAEQRECLTNLPITVRPTQHTIPS